MTLAAYATWVILPVLGLALAVCFLRLARGPSIADRVVALEMMSACSVGIAAALAVSKGRALYMDVALILALISFLGTVAFARYLERTR
jgi:multicomponent Na+:H+ antiporter subunit F